jgi:hypothetical protein
MRTLPGESTPETTSRGETASALPTGLVRDLARVPGWAQEAATSTNLTTKAKLVEAIERTVVDVMRHVAVGGT